MLPLFPRSRKMYDRMIDDVDDWSWTKCTMEQWHPGNASTQFAQCIIRMMLAVVSTGTRLVPVTPGTTRCTWEQFTATIGYSCIGVYVVLCTVVLIIACQRVSYSTAGQNLNFEFLVQVNRELIDAHGGIWNMHARQCTLYASRLDSCKISRQDFVVICSSHGIPETTIVELPSNTQHTIE